MARTIRASDWIAVATEQAKFCRAAHGIQLVPSIVIKTVPFTPGTFAFKTFTFWNGAVDAVFAAAVREGKAIPLPALVGVDLDGFAVAPSSGIFLSGVPASVAAQSPGGAVKQSAQRIDTALRTMLDAMSKGSNPGTRNDEGLLCLDGNNAARFWDSVNALGREFSFLNASTSISAEEFWEVVQEGAKEGLKNVGEAAGSALAAVGEGAGNLTSGFFKGLGVVNTAIVVGGGYLVVKHVW